ncbi:hypothetical protein [Natrinema caseinilyticum]|uniref:hypothetical protein n=1 Tax=Natrinema caseinilyticum TaxID=2961570 RepID=UPI0030F44C2B
MCGTTLEHMRICVRVLHGWAVRYDVGIINSGSQFENGSFTDPDIEEQVRKLGRMVVNYAYIEPISTDEYSLNDGEN